LFVVLVTVIRDGTVVVEFVVMIRGGGAIVAR
jgi:hypothetical protein